MREVQIFIGDGGSRDNERIDLFKDENIELTQRIKEIRDISSVFTDFAQQFSIPASSRNNKIFKHFYNFDITTGYFDARKYTDARIYINHILFKRGRITLNSVKMLDKKPNLYKISFFGNTLKLKDVLGENELNSLDLTAFDVSSTDIKTIFEGTGKTVEGDVSALIFPLITSEKRLFYNSSLADDSDNNFDGNLYRGGSTDRYKKRGVKPRDLKPAIKLKHIISAIESKYSEIEFTSNSFIKRSNPALDNLYMWISNSRGSIFDDDRFDFINKFNNFTRDTNSSDMVTVFISDDQFINLGIGSFEEGGLITFVWNVIVKVNLTSADAPYKIRVISDIDGSVLEQNGDSDNDFTFDVSNNVAFQRLRIEMASQSSMTANIDVDIKYQVISGFSPTQTSIETYFVNDNSDITTSGTISIRENIPKMKILDFLKGVFKMFNLTAYYIDDRNDTNFGKINVLTYDEYYDDSVNNQSGGTIDVTKYIDVSSHVVNTSFPFSDIDFKYSKQDTLLIKQHDDVFGEIFGNSHFPVAKIYPNMITNDSYEIELPFGHLKYERLRDGGNNNLTEIQWGYSAGGEFTSKEKSPFTGYNSATSDHKPPTGNYKPVNIKPLLFYGIRETSISNAINFSEDDNSASHSVTSYYRPSNSNEEGTSSVAPSFTINFDAEIDEFNPDRDFGEDTNSLFNKFYRKYITSVFDQTKRIFMYKAFLPPSFLIHYKLNDQLKIQDVVYRINSITTNLNTGESNIELINLKSDEIV